MTLAGFKANNHPQQVDKRGAVGDIDDRGTIGDVFVPLPANRTEQTWWQELVEPFRDRPDSPLAVEFIPGRLRFLKPGQGIIRPNERPPFGCCLLIWRPERAGSGFHPPPRSARLFVAEEAGHQ